MSEVEEWQARCHLTRSQSRSPEPSVCRRRDCLPGHIYNESFFRHLRTKPGSKRGRWQDRRQGPVMMGPGRGTEKGEENTLYFSPPSRFMMRPHASVNESARDPVSRGTCTVPSCCIRRRPPPDPSLSLSLSTPRTIRLHHHHSGQQLITPSHACGRSLSRVRISCRWALPCFKFIFLGFNLIVKTLVFR